MGAGQAVSGSVCWWPAAAFSMRLRAVPAACNNMTKLLDNMAARPATPSLRALLWKLEVTSSRWGQRACL
jgi:hypothetical protein